MTANHLQNVITVFVESSPLNIVQADKALNPSDAGMRIFDNPIFGYASAEDDMFDRIRNTPSANMAGLMLPGRWLEGAKTVVSFFLPFTEQVRESNRADMSWPSEAWLNARIEGQEFINQLSGYICETLSADGYGAVAPSIDSRFKAGPIPNEDQTAELEITSNWSERHAAFTAGLGTFSLNRGLITARGIAGRFGSVITTLELSPKRREYSEIDEYCTKCGLCARNCPAGAIDISTGKRHAPCRDFLDKTRRAPYYGCGKCQVGVPCETKIPALRSR